MVRDHASSSASYIAVENSPGSQLGRFVVRQERRVEFTNESRGIDVPLRSFSDGRH